MPDELKVDMPADRGSARDFLDEDDKVEEKEEEKIEEKVEDKEEEEETEEEPELELDDEDNEEEVEDSDEKEEEEEEYSVGLPTFRDIKAKYPKLFKDFPELGDAYTDYKKMIREAPNAETIRDFREKAETFDFLSASVSKGEPEAFLKATKEQGALDAFSSKFLPSLKKIDKAAFQAAVDPVFRELIQLIRQEGEETKDENMTNVGKLLTKFLYGRYELPKQEEIKDDPRLRETERRLADKEKAIELRESTRFIAGLERSTAYKMTLLIEKSLPKDEALPNFVKRALIRDVLDGYEEIMKKDSRHMDIARKLMQEAKKAGFDDASKGKVVNQYLSRARLLIPKLVSKLLAESKKHKETKPDKDEESSDKKSEPRKERKIDDKRPLREQMTAREFLDS